MRLGIFAALLFFSLPWVASAQLAGTAAGVDGTPFTISASPTYPSPYSTVTLSFVSGALDLANATMVVTAAGKTTYQGNVGPVSITLGKAGSVTPVTVKIVSNGASYTQTTSLQPQDVSLVAEPVSSVPPLYAGKSFVPLEGDVRLVAVANLITSGGKALDPLSLSYAWSVDGRQVADVSGIGKETILVAAPLQYRSRDVSVRVTSQDGTLVGGATLSLSSLPSLVRVYVQDPLLGIRYEQAVSSSYTIPGAESSLYAAPFSVPTSDGAPSVQWFLNGVAAQGGNSITLRPTGSGEGSASLSVVVDGDTTHPVSAAFSVLFGGSSGFNFFGL